MTNTKAEISREYDLLCELEALLLLASVKARSLRIELERDLILEDLGRLHRMAQFGREIQGDRVVLGHGDDENADENLDQGFDEEPDRG